MRDAIAQRLLLWLAGIGKESDMGGSSNVIVAIRSYPDLGVSCSAALTKSSDRQTAGAAASLLWTQRRQHKWR